MSPAPDRNAWSISSTIPFTHLRFEMGEGSAGFQLAREAIAAYGPHHPRIPRIAHEVAVYLMEQRGDHVNALTVFRELANCTFRPADLLLLHGNTARAAAGAGEMLVFEKARTLRER